MSENNKRTGLFVGLNKGHIVNTTKASKVRPVMKKGRITKRVKAIREVIKEVAGFSPLEKKMLELIRTGVASKEKKAVKCARAKIGTHHRALKLRDSINAIIQAQSRKK